MQELLPGKLFLPVAYKGSPGQLPRCDAGGTSLVSPSLAVLWVHRAEALWQRGFWLPRVAANMKPTVRRQCQNNFSKDWLKLEVEPFNSSAEWVAGFCPHGTAPWVCPYVPPCAQFGPTLPPIGITLSCWCSKAFQIVAASILILHSTQNFLLNVEDPYWRPSLAKAPLFLTISIDSYKGDGLS